MLRDYYKLLVEGSPDALYAVSPEGEILDWNSGAESTFGYSRLDALGKSLDELLIPIELHEEAKEQRRSVLASGSATYETLRRRKDGSLIYIHASTRAVHNAEGQVDFLVMSDKDVTQVKVLRDSRMIEARYRDLLESTPDAIVIINDTGRIVMVNGEAERQFGYTRAELLNRPIEILLPQRYRGAHVGHRSNYFLQPRTRPMGAGLELFGLRKNAEEFPVEIGLSPLATEESRLVMSAIRDITERKRFEQALREKNIELEKANRAKDRFLATMSHELRTPLNAVIGFTGTLLMRLPGPLNPDQERQLRTVQRSANHLLALINDLLDLAKIESGKVDLNREPVLCQTIVQDVVTALRPLAEAKGLRLEASVPTDKLVVQSDRRCLHQVLLNLASNAIKFTEQGHVKIELSRGREGDTVLTELCVTDSGIGIRPEDQARLFQAFSRISPADGRRVEGTGLGLHLSQKLAELLGGRITLQSEPGAGSRFSLILEEH